LSTPPLKKKKKKLLMEVEDLPVRPKPQAPKLQIRQPIKRGRPKQPEGISKVEPQPEPEEPPDLILHEESSDMKATAPIIFVSEGEELVRIQKATDESEDSEIDIDDVGDLDKPSRVVESVVEETFCDPKYEIDVKSESEEIPEEKPLPIFETEKPEVVGENDKVFEFSIPTQEVCLKPEEIGEQEKEVHFEFFTGRPTKTPSRYLKVKKK